MNKFYFIGLFIVIFPGRKIPVQNFPAEGNTAISEILDKYVPVNDEQSNPAELADELHYFLEHPLDINHASAEELRQLHLLTEFQIFSLTEYILEHGYLLSAWELQLVYGFDRQLIISLLPFVEFSSEAIKSKYPSGTKKPTVQRLLIRAGMNGSKKAGFKPDNSGEREFKGKDRNLMLKYQAEISSINIGFTAEQDAGESFTSGGKGFSPDFTSAFFEYTGNGPVRKVVIGDYSASWGQGLVLGGYGTRKGKQVLLSPVPDVLKKYSSSGETNFFRGAATSLVMNKFSLEVLVSKNKIDAALHTMSKGPDTIRYFTSVNQSGLHRSNTEIEMKDALTKSDFGIHARISHKIVSWGFSYLDQQFDHPWIRNSTAYTNEFIPPGTNLRNFGTDVKACFGKVALFSEVAADTKTKIALFSGILAELHPLVRLSLLYRNYQPDYLGIKSSGFGESQGTKNEEGFYLGLQIYPWKFIKADIYADHYSFPFLRYNSTCPYAGNDYLLHFAFLCNRELTLNLQFRYEKSLSRSSIRIDGIDLMETSVKAGNRMELIYEMNRNINLKSRIEFSYFRMAGQALTTGFYSGHDISLISSSQKYKLWLRYAIYDIPGWDNRIYAFENDVLYSFSVPAYNSKGTRFVILGKSEILEGIELSIRYSVSGFTGIRTWGSGNDLVTNGNDSYLTFQLGIKL